MANTYTTGLRLTKPGLGDAGWGTTVNNGLTDLVDQAVAGQVRVDVTTAGPFVLTLSDGAVSDGRSMFIYAFGTPGGAREIQVPARSNAVNKLFFVRNDSNGAVTVKVSGQTGVVVPVNASMVLKMNDGGTDVVEGITYTPISSGGTGAATQTAAFDALAPTTTKGDLIAHDGTDNVRVPVGTNGKVLVADSGAAAGVAWSDGTVTGEIKMWPTGSAPTGYLLCNGAEVSRSTYAALFAVIGTTFGSAGPTTFTLPNYNNRMPIGAGGLYALGATGGSKDAIVVAHDHTYSATTGNQSADHTHTFSATTGTESQDHTHSGTTDSAGAHSHFTNGYSAGGSTIDGLFSNANPSSPVNTDVQGAHTHTFTTGGVSANHTHSVSGTTGTVSANHNHSVSGTTASTGSSGTDANLPPYLAINFIIKI